MKSAVALIFALSCMGIASGQALLKCECCDNSAVVFPRKLRVFFCTCWHVVVGGHAFVLVCVCEVFGVAIFGGFWGNNSF